MSSAHTAFQKATEFHRTGDRVAAEEQYRQALASDPDFADAASNLAVLLAQQGQHEQALACYHRVLELQPEHAETLSNAGNTLWAMGRLDEAESYHRRAIASDPSLASAHTNLGNLYYHRDRLQQAADCYRTALAIDPLQTEGYNNLGSVLGRMGQLQEAAAAYEQGLAIAPDSADVHMNLANLHFMLGASKRAEPHLRRVIDLLPDWAKGYSDLGLCLKYQDRLDEAEAMFLQAVELDPFLDSAWQRLAEMRLDAGNPDGCLEALEQASLIDPENTMTQLCWGNFHASRDEQEQAAAWFARVCESEPENASYLNCLGNALHFSHRYDEAIEVLTRAVTIDPRFAEGFNNLANVHVSRNEREIAVTFYRKSLEVAPEQAIVACNLGNVLRDLARIDEAVASFRRGIEIDPKLHNAYNGLGLALQVQNRHDASIEAFRTALDLKPDYAEALNNLAISLTGLGRYHEAVDIYNRLLEVKPDLPEAMFNLGTLLQTLSRWDQSVVVFMKAIDCRPDYNIVYPYLAHSLMQQCSWTNLDGIIERIRSNVEMELAADKPASISAFALQSMPGEFSMAMRQQVAEQICRRCANNVAELRKELQLSFPRRRRNPKLRIGYLSPDFRFHSVAVAFKGILDHHDRDRFELFGYSLHSGPDDSMTDELRKGFDGFQKISDMPFRDAAHRIASDEIDILVDLAGHTRGAQLEMLALRAAPIQAHYLGYSATVGAKFLDYLITDHQQVPEEQRPFFTEKLVYLPDTFMATQRAPVAIEVPSRAQCGLPEDTFVFCNFNAHYKFEPRLFAIWMRLLRKLPNAVLWMMGGTAGSVTNLRREAQARGVDPSRLIFAERTPHPIHLARLSHVDLALDNLYHGGGVTSVDCLWTGVPVLTLAGPTPQSRNGASLLAAMDMMELVTDSLSSYEKLAMALAGDRDRLTRMHEDLLARRNTHPLFRPQVLTRHLERGYELMWQRYEAGEPPAIIDVPHITD